MLDGGTELNNGGLFACQACALISADVCRRARLPGGTSTFERGWGPGGGGGGGWTRIVEGDDCEVFALIDPYGRRVLTDKFEGTVGR